MGHSHLPPLGILPPNQLPAQRASETIICVRLFHLGNYCFGKHNANYIYNVIHNDGARPGFLCVCVRCPPRETGRCGWGAGTDKGREEAAAALWSLSITNSKLKMAVAHAGAIPPMLTLLGAGTAAGKEEAAGVLWTLLSHEDERQVRSPAQPPRARS